MAAMGPNTVKIKWCPQRHYGCLRHLGAQHQGCFETLLKRSSRSGPATDEGLDPSPEAAEAPAATETNVSSAGQHFAQ
ncbi:hypothetical protein Hypma_014596 [Hypsizygus marmoreus]|uniref:Uncharacterized protein n=1 Tax=Hypsizygus marmoreus TaxID=39966 RepID=A0A369JBT7_HYPMA|nr:hypothetical protein Hypma_014596 [Hypsizygus marmoreus]